MSPALSVLVPLVLYNIGFLLYLGHFRYKKGLIYFHQSNNYVGCCIFLCLLINVFATYDGDWWHYKDIIAELYINPTTISHLEPVHLFIVKYLSFGENLIWRFIIWSICLLFTYLSFRKLNINNLLTWTCYIVFFALYFYSTGRVSVAIAIQFYGYTCIIAGTKKIRSKLYGIFWIIISLFFHKTAFLTIIPIVASFFPLKKWQFIMCFMGLPFAIILFRKYLILFILAGEASDGMMRYLDKGQSAEGIGSQIMTILFNFAVSGVYIISVIRLYFRKLSTPYYIHLLFRYVTFILLEYFVVYGALTAAGIGSTAISARILPMALLPLVIIYAYLWTKRRWSFALFFFGLLGIIAINYRLLYAYYLYSLGTGI